MVKLRESAGKHPTLFVLVPILSWFLVGAIAAGLASIVLRTSFLEPGPQIFGTLAATLYVLAIAWRFNWAWSMAVAAWLASVRVRAIVG